MTRTRLSSLRTRLALIAIIALIPAVLFLLLDAWAVQRSARADADDDQLRLTALVADAYSHQLDEAERLMSAVALFPEVRYGDAAACSARLAEVAQQVGAQYARFGVSNLDGEMFCTYVPLTTTVQIADRLWYQEALRTGTFAIGDYTLSRPSNLPIVGLGYPVRDEQGRVARVLSHGLQLSQLQAEASALPLPADAVLTITDRNGVILARTPDGEPWLGQQENDPLLQHAAAAADTAGADTASPSPASPAGAGTEPAGADASSALGRVVQATGIDGVTRLYASAPIRGPSGDEVWLSIGRSPDEVDQAVWQATERDLFGVATMLLALLAAIWIGSDRLILRKIDRLTAASRVLGAGDLHARAPVGTSGDELDQLSTTINEMAAALQQRQAEVLERERHLHLALQVARMVAWTWDPKADKVETTENIVEVYGLPNIDAVAQGFDVVHPDDKERHWGIVSQAAAQKQAYHSVFRIIRPDNGAIVWLDERAISILDDRGEVQKLTGVVMDITERRQAEEALRAAQERTEQAAALLEVRVAERTAELERSNRELNQFAYVASHDLKAPLRAIEVLAGWITQDAGPVLPPESAAHLDKLRGRVQRMEQLLDDLLAYSRAGRIRPPAQRVDVPQLVQDITAMLAPPAGFTVTVDGPTPALYTPRASLELVLRNLIGNAIKHHGGPAGKRSGQVSGQVSGTVTVRCRPEDDGDLLCFSVTDDGPGIDPQYHTRIFELFQTLNPRDQVEGSGMGLAIVKKLVESYGGTIRVDSTAGHGATFSFTWPQWITDGMQTG